MKELSNDNEQAKDGSEESIIFFFSLEADFDLEDDAGNEWLSFLPGVVGDIAGMVGAMVGGIVGGMVGSEAPFVGTGGPAVVGASVEVSFGVWPVVQGGACKVQNYNFRTRKGTWSLLWY